MEERNSNYVVKESCLIQNNLRGKENILYDIIRKELSNKKVKYAIHSNKKNLSALDAITKEIKETLINIDEYESKKLNELLNKIREY